MGYASMTWLFALIQNGAAKEGRVLVSCFANTRDPKSGLPLGFLCSCSQEGHRLVKHSFRAPWPSWHVFWSPLSSPNLTWQIRPHNPTNVRRPHFLSKANFFGHALEHLDPIFIPFILPIWPQDPSRKNRLNLFYEMILLWSLETPRVRACDKTLHCFGISFLNYHPGCLGHSGCHTRVLMRWYWFELFSGTMFRTHLMFFVLVVYCRNRLVFWDPACKIVSFLVLYDAMPIEFDVSLFRPVLSVADILQQISAVALGNTLDRLWGSRFVMLACVGAVLFVFISSIFGSDLSFVLFNIITRQMWGFAVITNIYMHSKYAQRHRQLLFAFFDWSHIRMYLCTIL